jgi:hypothetical protein
MILKRSSASYDLQRVRIVEETGVCLFSLIKYRNSLFILFIIKCGGAS